MRVGHLYSIQGKPLPVYLRYIAVMLYRRDLYVIPPQCSIATDPCIKV